VNYPFEYPALSGALFYISTLAGSVTAFYSAISLILYSFMLVGLFAMCKIFTHSGQPISGIGRHVILIPTFLIYSIFSFDWIGISLLLVAIYYSYARRPLPSGVFLGLSIAARLIPIVCLPFIILEFKRARERVILLAASAGAWLAPNLYFMVVNFQGFLYPYLFQAKYPYEDSWLEIIYAFSLIATKILSGLLLLSLLALILLSRDKFSLLEASMLAMLAFVMSSYKFPPQYLILLIPFFALNRVSYRLSLSANTLNVLIFLFWAPSIPFFGNPTLITSPVQWIAILRQLVLLPIFLRYLLAHRTDGVTSRGTNFSTSNQTASGSDIPKPKRPISWIVKCQLPVNATGASAPERILLQRMMKSNQAPI